jgi:hypothetical protein
VREREEEREGRVKGGREKRRRERKEKLGASGSCL